ncbi:DNA repair and recombination protein RAD54B-like [Patiria miniata]|uniref:DNA repair and recombination protein RAD54B n=1 Tax=Patiria miniata TaxID=46514 RepID=A0A913ZQW3_PATMI|nr:DNA repair and recombination protein RAD54B-like [Patiria miniata]XP_038053767.1 DNA repair and recombination protein RAD54B-like [Patiria miniata]XP_038053768.1 DNA repair and recombination protein RAD54B-like [Patiria miniata]XP_038053769.1 DNA repair and recombination protein RAD54B-like [Patiria miniata]XP_038053771.1 DNA repair and recombination protein RAD54B-like [Patiria miniata]XP_038053772.1 DNA repair and recombination protein RAD54B-like [Patiria miniata]XP_038053773.1 DNA repa
MRRSAAPSQLASASKRPRFTPPFAGNTTSTAQRSVPNSSTSNPSLMNTEVSTGTSNVLQLVQQKKESAEQLSCNGPSSRTKLERPRVNTGFASGHSAAAKENSHSGKVSGAKLVSCLTDAAILPCSLPNQPSGPTEQSSKLTSSSNDGEKESCHKTVNDENISSPEQATPTTSNPSVKPRINGLHRGTFRQPLLQKPLPSKPIAEESLEEAASHYYNVVWCKLSKKKHKKWEGDAILVTKGKSVTLLDTEGKEIGKGRGYKSSELSSMAEGHTLCIGGKEIEVMGEIKHEDFTSGKCFQTTAAVSSLPSDSFLTKPRPAPAKPFTNPQKATSSENNEAAMTVKSTPKPLHDPTHPDALVMPRPSPAHQWAHNPAHHPVVDVVLDPYLSSKLRPHQREGVLFLYECVMGMRGFQGNGAILADDMGLGKTLQCICLIWTLLKQGPYRAKPVVKRILVVTPGSLVKNWCREFKKWLGNERMRVFPVSADKKVQEFASSPIYPVLVISYEMFVRSIDDIRKITFDLIVCDEGHRLKNTNIKTTSLISSLPVQRRILLTGTPVQNDLQEFHSIVEFCNPGVLGSSASFHRVYEDPITKGNQPQATAEEKTLAATRAAELSRLTGLFVLRRTQEINNKYLPPKVETVVFCKPSPLQLLLYQKLLGSRVLRGCLTASSQYADSSSSSPHLVCIMALKKLCNHPGLLHQVCLDAAMEQRETSAADEGFVLEESLYKDLLPLFPDIFTTESLNVEHSGKMKVLADLLHSMHKDELKEKIVLVSNYTQTLSLLQKLCEQEGYKFCRLDGSTPTAKRQEIVEHFNSSYAQETVFLLSSKAGGVGLNLIGASRLLLYDIDWNPANDLQAMARVWRDGQKKRVHIYRLITTGTIEEKVYQRQISKQGLSGAVVDAKSHGHVKFSLEDLRDLFTLHESTACITHDMMDCKCLKGETVTEAPRTAPSRACQIGAKKKKDLKNLSMNQLMEWKHFPGPLSSVFEDGHLLPAGSLITFVFQNKTNVKSADV